MRIIVIIAIGFGVYFSEGHLSSRIRPTTLRCGAAAGFAGAYAAAYPEKPIRLIVPYPPGVVTTFLAAIWGSNCLLRLKQQAVIDNRGGANGIIGTDLASQAPADGYRLLMLSTSFTVNAAVHALPYDMKKEF